MVTTVCVWEMPGGSDHIVIKQTISTEDNGFSKDVVCIDKALLKELLEE